MSENNNYTTTEIQEGERKKEKLLRNIGDATATIEKIVEEIEKGKKSLADDEEMDDFEKDDLREWVSQLEAKMSSIKRELDAEKNRIRSIDVNYDELKTEPSDNIYNNKPDSFNIDVPVNGPLMMMFVEYLNYLNTNKMAQKSSGIVVKYIFDEDHMFEDDVDNSIQSSQKYDCYVLISFKNTDVMVSLRKFFSDNKFKHIISLSSNGRTILNEEYLYKKLLFNSISHSNIKGKYITFEAGDLQWEVEILEKRDFTDIFLPEGNMQDLQLYTQLFNKSGRLLRYLMVGNPGTCKTESTIAIANILKDKGVTIMKTQVCKAFKQKVELAELLSPSILILDDIDLSLGSRSSGMISSTLADFLGILDGTEKLRKDVGIIATTNSLELLDLAAQRPGRFDKLLALDSLTADNIKNIIIKSLRYGFGLGTDDAIVGVDKLRKVFTHDSIIDEFHKSKVTGSHIYNAISMLTSRIDTLEMDVDKITSEWVLNEIKNDISTIERIRNTHYLSDKLSNSSNGKKSSIGFSIDQDEIEMYLPEPEQLLPGGSMYSINSKLKTDE